MGIISIEQLDRLYWLGRYTERVYTTLRFFSKSFDSMIDEIGDSYPEYCRKLDIPNIYIDKEDFLKRYPFDTENTDSIISSLNRAYDNAIVLRDSIGSEALSYVQLAIYDMNRAAISKAPLIEMQRVIDNILAFWGIADDSIDSSQVRNIIKAGKRIERVDLLARLGIKRSELIREVNRMASSIKKSGRAYDVNKIEKIASMIMAENINYCSIVEAVNNIF